MSNKEIDKAISNVIASFQIDGIEIAPEFILQVREKMIQKNNKNKLSKNLVKKER